MEKNNETQRSEEKSDVAHREEEMLAFWNEHDIFNKSVAKDAPNGDFVFYDGPPFATGLPHYGHILAGTIKDAIPRFWTMNGYRVVRKWGWDCHGLPLENIIEKRLGLATKRDIEEMGVKQFNEAARGAVLEYADDWKKIVPRMGRFVDMEDDYKTMDPSYTETVWWVFSELNKKGLVYEGFKSMHLCPRCGTTLSNFEVNQGYKDIKDIAVTVKLPLLDDAGNRTDTSLLVWTTTPWTLPGNMAAAVHEDIEYAKVRVTADEGEDIVILAKARLAQLGTEEYEILETFKGKELVGRSYVPPFDYFKDRDIKGKENAWKLYHAPYVELGEEGTGAVHLAPAYGEEDMNLANREGVPIVHHVSVDGRFMDFVTDFKGQLVKPKDDENMGVTHLASDIEIVRKLNEKGLLFKKENITHSYPHCWRCDTPLLNYATTSWFVRVTDLKDKLVAENEKIHWVPEHVGRSRFGKWLEGARDWAISRQRYWGAPLPIWRNPSTKEYKVIGSLKELHQYVRKSGNTYFLMRHGESEFNTKGILNGVPGVQNGLTDLGKKQTKETAEKLKEKKIDYIYYSPLERTEETARLIAAELGVGEDHLRSDDRILEMQFGQFEGENVSDYHAFFGSGINRLAKRPERGENWTDVKQRTGSFIYDIDTKHQNERILIVTHNGTLQMLQAVAYGDNKEETGTLIDDNTYDFVNAEVRELSFTPIPHNDNYELDYHRPYIDEIELFDTDGTKLERVPDVFDCWFESGSMPYGQNHYPFENTDGFEPKENKGYPANFIAEGLDQTRGWFYSLLVLGTALFGKAPYQNVIVNGLVLAEDGKKMSKSLQNYPDPMEVADRTGVDAIRFYLLSSPVVKAEDLNFSEKEVLELQRKNLGRLHNVLLMYETYAHDNVATSDTSEHVLDRWIIARLNKLVLEVTHGFKSYELDRATRPVTDFIDDLSVWYLRRSRDRLKQNTPQRTSASLRGPDAPSAVTESTSPSVKYAPGIFHPARLASDVTVTRSVGDESDKDADLALSTLRYVLKTLSLLVAPSMPFYAEYLFSRVKEENDAESVHLMAWPAEKTVDEGILEEMKVTRHIVSLALEARAKANIKIRQPLQTLKVKHPVVPEAEPYLVLVRDEVNVKEIVSNVHIDEEVELDTAITPELRAEGDAREFIRQVQELRKKAGLEAKDRIVLAVQTSGGGEDTLRAHEDVIKRVTGADSITYSCAEGEEIIAGDHSFTVSITKI